MEKKRKERISQYSDELEPEEIEQIENISIPWQRNFLFRFYEQLRKKELKKTDICRNANKQTDKYHLLHSKEYTHKLNENTLTQYSSLKAKNITPINVNNLIAVSNALGVSINYLLGIDSCENPENTDINKATGLNNETIDIIKKSKGLQDKLNFFITSSNLEDIGAAIDSECRMQHLSQDILNVYNKTLFEKIATAFKKFHFKVFPLDRNLEKYQDYLCAEISLEEIEMAYDTGDSMMSYLKENLSTDLVNQIKLNLECIKESNEIEIYNVFINDTAQRTYEILEHRYSKEIRMSKIIQSFQLILDDYIQEHVKETKKNIKSNIKTTD